nr:hypothetical protein [Fimbriimonadaceae bacterium]
MIDPEQNISSHRRGSEFASVVITDLARYSPDTNSEKHRMVTLLTDLAHACPTFQAAEASQNVVANSQGDGFVVAFLGDPLGAFHFMQELLKALRNLAPEERLRFGIHVGTLIVQEADIAGKPNMVGEAVDYAARAMSQAKPGQVMLTEAAYWASWQEAINHPFLEPAGRFTIKHGEEIDLYELVEPDSGKQDFWLALAHKTIARSSAKATTLAHPRVIATRFALLAQEFLLLCICLFSIVGLAWALKNLPLVRPLHQASHRLLVNLAPWQETREEPLVILDLERNLTYPNFEGRTNTRDLAKIVEALAELRPSAIGIDIDFGRESKEWQPPFADQGLSSYPDFDHSVARAARAATQSSVPTFLGIDRGITGPDDALIGVDLSDRVSTYDAHFAFVAIVKPTDGTVIDLPLRVLRPAEPKSIP